MLGLQGPSHELPKNVVEYLSKFDGEGSIHDFQYIRNYECKIILLIIMNQEIVYQLFPTTLKEKNGIDTMSYPFA